MGAGDTTIDAEHKHPFYFLILSIYLSPSQELYLFWL